LNLSAASTFGGGCNGPFGALLLKTGKRTTKIQKQRFEGALPKYREVVPRSFRQHVPCLDGQSLRSFSRPASSRPRGRSPPASSCVLQRRWRASSTSRGIHRTKFPFESVRVARAAAVPLCFSPQPLPYKCGSDWTRSVSHRIGDPSRAPAVCSTLSTATASVVSLNLALRLFTRGSGQW